MTKAADKYREVMRDHLLDAANAVLAKKGIAQATVRDIVSEADIAPGTLYAYFNGKDELFQALAERHLNEHLKLLSEQAESLTAARTLAWILASALSNTTPFSSLLVELRGSSADVDAVRRWNGLVVSATDPLLQRMKVEGFLDVEETDVLAELLDIIWEGMNRRAINGTFVTSYKQIGALVAEMLNESVLDVATEEGDRAPVGVAAAQPEAERYSPDAAGDIASRT